MSNSFFAYDLKYENKHKIVTIANCNLSHLEYIRDNTPNNKPYVDTDCTVIYITDVIIGGSCNNRINNYKLTEKSYIKICSVANSNMITNFDDINSLNDHINSRMKVYDNKLNTINNYDNFYFPGVYKVRYIIITHNIISMSLLILLKRGTLGSLGLLAKVFSESDIYNNRIISIIKDDIKKSIYTVYTDTEFTITNTNTDDQNINTNTDDQNTNTNTNTITTDNRNVTMQDQKRIKIINNEDNTYMVVKVHDVGMSRILANIPSSLVILSLYKFYNNNIDQADNSNDNDNTIYDYAKACFSVIHGLQNSVR
jgi:hypothetical protein